MTETPTPVADTKKAKPALPPALFTIGDFSQMISGSRTSTYRLIKRGEIRTVRLGGRQYVPASELDRISGGAA